MGNGKRLAINMVATIVAFIVNMGISFFLSPYVIEHVGVDAYGFVSLANNFVNYASIITLALNSMAGRFITIAIHKGNKEEANKYFNSVLLANIIICLVLLIPAIIMIIFLEKIINIPIDLTLDTKILFGFVFLNFALGIINTTYSIATFVRNRLDLNSKRNIESYIIKAIMLFVLFTFCTPKIAYIGIVSCIISLYIVIWNIKYTKQLLPEIEINKKFFEFKKIMEIIKSGIWNTITKMGQILADGLDLLICNLFIDSVAMGQLSIAKTLSGVISNLLGTISSIFQPQLTIYYAKNEINNLISELKRAMKITGVFANIPLSYLIVFGSLFYSVWVPNQDIQLISILTILTVQGEIISGIITPMYSIYTVTNKIKVDAIIRLITGFVVVGVVFMFVKTTNLGIYAVAATSIILGTIVNVTFVPIYVAKKCLNIKWNTFYPIILRYISTTLILIAVLFGIKHFIHMQNWVTVFGTAFITGIVGLICNYLLLFSNKEKKDLINNLLKFIKRGEKQE